MFDIFLSFDFRKSNREKSTVLRFSEIPVYKEIKYNEATFNFPNGYATYLERNNTDKNYLKRDRVHYFIYGSLFTNKKYQNLKTLAPHKVTPEELAALYIEFDENIVLYLKGSFVLVFVDEENFTVKAITDRLNVLPLYYCYKDQMLVLSSSVRMILKTGFVSNEMDYQALTEQLLFDYMLRDHYFYKDIRQTENGCIYSFNSKQLTNNHYWSVEDLYHEILLPRKDSLKLLSEQLFENVNLYTSDREKVLVSFTGGFDGRTNVAMIRKSTDDYLCYSYGMPGSKQITIPETASKQMNIQYRPIYLDEQYEQQYDQCAFEAIEFSNGTAPIMRANYPYAYKQLCNFSDITITGLFGSEILRPLHNLGIQINNHSESIFLDEDYKVSILNSIQNVNRKKYLQADILNSSTEKIIETFKADYFDKYAKYDKITRFFFFILQEGIRKYFMQEIQIERVYVTTRFPYLDDDLVELIYKTTFAGMYNGFLKKSMVKRRKGQLLYAHIINKYKPELGKILLDRGYKPNDLLKPFPINYVYLANGVYQAKKYQKKLPNDTFNSKKWTKQTITKSINLMPSENIFAEGMINVLVSNEYLKDLLSFSHMVSLKNFIR
jgi:hypothetical protein